MRYAEGYEGIVNMYSDLWRISISKSSAELSSAQRMAREIF
jgi:hypothetical protein